jgi:hypothetical protein
MTATDGKQRLTGVATTEQVLRRSTPSRYKNPATVLSSGRGWRIIGCDL